MAENQVQIEVELVGQKEVGQGLEKITKGAEGVGNTFKSVGDVVGKTNQQLGEGLSSVSDALGETMNAVGGVKEAFGALGQGGSMSLLGLLGPVSLVVTALGAAYEAFRQLSGAAQEAEDNAESMAAAANDLESKLEALAEKGALPATEALGKFTRMTLDAQFAKEKLIKQYERLTRAYVAEQSAVKETARLQAELNRLMEDSQAAGARLVSVGADLVKARRREEAATEKLQRRLVQLRETQEAVSVQMEQAAKMELAFEENSYDVALAKAKELAERKKSLDLMAVEAQAVDEEVDALRALAVEEEARALALKIKQAEDAKNLSQILAIRDELTRLIDVEHKETEALTAQAKAEKIVEDARAKRREKMKQDATQRQADAKAVAAEATQRQALLSQSILLDIQLTAEGDAQKYRMAAERYRLGLELAKDDAMKRAVVEKSYQLELKRMNDERTAREKAAAEERLKVQAEEMRAAVEMDYERQAFDLQHLQRTKTLWESFKGGLWFSSEETDRQLEELQLRYEKEYELAQGNLERQNELVRRFAVERTSIERAQAEAQRQIVASVVQEYGKGVAEAAVGFAIFGDNFKEATAAVLDGLAKQSGVRALMEVAEGLGALAFGSPSAGAHFASAAKFAVAAALAGGASAAAGGRAFGGAGGKKNNADSTSPSGSPQTSATPARATATQSQIVYNVNFGGAVVYDTKRAAEMALTQRIDRRRGEMRGAR
jgi:hypothetical protein